MLLISKAFRPARVVARHRSILLSRLKRCLWGWRLTVAIIATQVLGGLVNLFRGRIIEGATGVIVASVVLFYLLRRKIRAVFEAKVSAFGERTNSF